MSDLLTHVLVAYIGFTVLSWRIEWLTRRWIVIGMGGAMLPDLEKLGTLLGVGTETVLFGVPVNFSVFSTLGGVAVTAAIGAVLFEDKRRRAYGLLVAGGCSGLVIDGARAFASGRSGFWLYPVWWRPPTPSLYVSSDPLPLVLALIASLVTFILDRRGELSG